MEEVGCPREGQEEDPRPPRRHPHPEGEGPKGFGHHRSLPREEGGAADEARSSAVCDGTRGIIRRGRRLPRVRSPPPKSHSASRR